MKTGDRVRYQGIEGTVVSVDDDTTVPSMRGRMALLDLPTGHVLAPASKVESLMPEPPPPVTAPASPPPPAAPTQPVPAAPSPPERVPVRKGPFGRGGR